MPPFPPHTHTHTPNLAGTIILMIRQEVKKKIDLLRFVSKNRGNFVSNDT